MSSLGTHALGIDADDDRIVEALARRVVELLRAEAAVAGDEWVDCREVARRFGLSRSWVYAHSGQLGAVRLGDGPRARLRFAPSVVAEALRSGPAAAEREPVPSPPGDLPVLVPRVRSRKR
jgi:hypothetical protein